MEDKKPFDEKESLQLIAEMIQKAKSNFHESGTSAILWGTVVGICGLLSYAEMAFEFSIGFDIWWITLAAIIPQIFIVVRERKKKAVKTHSEHATDIVWMVYTISLICLVFYSNIVPGVSDRLYLEADKLQLMQKNVVTGEMMNWHIIIPSFTSVFLIIYAFPTLATGLITNFKAMIWGAVVCYGFFAASLFTSFKYDMLLSGLAGIGNWLIPGLLLRHRYLKGKAR